MSANRIVIAAVAAALSLTAPAAVFAQDGRAQSATVVWDDLDVTTPAGAAELNSRINTAARRACRGVRATGSNMSQTAFCRSQIKETVVGQMDEATREAYARAAAEARAAARSDRA